LAVRDLGYAAILTIIRKSTVAHLTYFFSALFIGRVFRCSFSLSCVGLLGRSSFGVEAFSLGFKFWRLPLYVHAFFMSKKLLRHPVVTIFTLALAMRMPV
jgi:hypothetical protein